MDRSTTSAQRILIVGGGIGGLALGAALTRCQLPFTVFEQAPALREAGAGVGLWSNALATLDALGAGEEPRRSSQALRRFAGANERGVELSGFDLDTLGPEFADAACRVVLRTVLLSALAAQVPPERIVTGKRCVRVEQDDATATLTFDDGAAETGTLIVGADGLHSVVRPQVLLRSDEPVRYSGQTCFRGVARMDPPSPGVLREVQGPGQRGAVCPVDHETVYWWVAHNAPEGHVVAPPDRRALLLERYAGWPFGLPEAIATTPADAILQNDLVDRAPVKRYVRGRLALVGDAAHPTTPNLGQGANMAIDDGLVLARALRDEPDLDLALDRYQRERLARTRQIVERSWSFGQLTRWKVPLLVWLRESLVRSTPRSVMTSALRSQMLEGVGTL